MLKSMKRKEKGVAGLNIFLSLIVMLFVIGILVFSFTLVGSNLRSANLVSANATGDENKTMLTNETYNLAATTLGLTGVSCTGFAYNASNYAQIIAAGNFTTSNGGCGYTPTQASNNSFNNTKWRFAYNYTYTTDSQQSGIISNTTISVGSATVYFPLFITLGAVVVIILLLVIVIVAMRGSGLIGGGEGGAGGSYGGGKETA